MPPGEEGPDLATAEKDKTSEVFGGRPDVGAFDAVTAPSEAGDGRVGCSLQVLTLSNEYVTVIDLDGEHLGGGVDEQRVGTVDAATAEGKTACRGLGIPEIPGLQEIWQAYFLRLDLENFGRWESRDLAL